MHDPDVLAFDIKYPWKDKPSKPFPKGWRRTCVAIWHHSPRGEDACGWSRPNLSETQLARLKSFAWMEGRDPYFLRCRAKEWDGSRAEAEALRRGLLLHVARLIGVRMSFEAAAKQAALEIHVPDCGDSAGFLCFLPGWHTNGEADTPAQREDHFHRLLCGIAGELLRARRPWWRHPRWHVHHWRIQCVPWQALRRLIFDRCAGCGGRFRRGESVFGSHWDQPPTPFLRSAVGVFHGRCHDNGSTPAPASPSVPQPQPQGET